MPRRNLSRRANPLRADRPLPPAVVAAGWVSLLTDVATEMVYPLLPAFIEATLGGGKAALGLIEGVAETTAAVVRLPAGLAVGSFSPAQAADAFGLRAGGVGAAAVGNRDRAMAGARGAVRRPRRKGVARAPRDALIADVTSTDQRGRAFGFHRAMDHAGAAIGPLIAFAFLWLWPGEYRWLFALTLIPGLIVIAVLYFGVREPERVGQRETATKRIRAIQRTGAARAVCLAAGGDFAVHAGARDGAACAFAGDRFGFSGRCTCRCCGALITWRRAG